PPLLAAMDSSYDRLAGTGRMLLDRWSVCAGGFALEAGVAVASGDGIDRDGVFDLVAALVARSLVEGEAEGAETRYRLLEIIRQYAQEHLDLTDETARVRDAHARYVAAFGEQAVVGVASPPRLAWR